MTLAASSTLFKNSHFITELEIFSSKIIFKLCTLFLISYNEFISLSLMVFYSAADVFTNRPNDGQKSSFKSFFCGSHIIIITLRCH